VAAGTIAPTRIRHQETERGTKPNGNLTPAHDRGRVKKNAAERTLDQWG